MTDTRSHEPALDPLLARLGRQRFVIYRLYAERGGDPEYLAGIHYWGEVADVVILRDEYRSWAYRLPLGDSEGGQLDVFDPDVVFWWYTASPGWTIRQLLELPQPAHPTAPRQLIEAPSDYRIPKETRAVVRVVMRPHQ